MTRRSAGLVAVITAILGVSVAFAADGPIKDRKDLMMGNGKSVKGVVAMLKGEAPYDGVGRRKGDLATAAKRRWATSSAARWRRCRKIWRN